jgi:hypothetical protein
VKISKEDMERIKQEHEDHVVREMRQAASHIHVKEIRRLVKEYGDGNKTLELWTGQPSKDIQHQEQILDEEMKEPLDEETAETETPQADILAASMEILSLEPTAGLEVGEPDQDTEAPQSMSVTNEWNSAKSKARQRRHVSATRKEKQSKRAQKEAAKHRKRMEAMGIEHVKESSGQEPILKAIVI